ncbi:hypothetical protein EJB05_52102, partial [Eragrostis curvula]
MTWELKAATSDKTVIHPLLALQSPGQSTTTSTASAEAGRVNVHGVDLGAEVLQMNRCDYECLAERFCIDEGPPVPQHMLPFLSLFQKPGAYVHRLAINGPVVELGAELLLNRCDRVLESLVEASCLVLRHMSFRILEILKSSISSGSSSTSSGTW